MQANKKQNTPYNVKNQSFNDRCCKHAVEKSFLDYCLLCFWIRNLLSMPSHTSPPLIYQLWNYLQVRSICSAIVFYQSSDTITLPPDLETNFLLCFKSNFLPTTAKDCLSLTQIIYLLSLKVHLHEIFIVCF